MEYIRLGDLVQQHHAIDAHNNIQHILPVAMAASIIWCMTEVGEIDQNLECTCKNDIE